MDKCWKELGNSYGLRDAKKQKAAGIPAALNVKIVMTKQLL